MKPVLVLATDSPEPSGVGEHMLTLGEALKPRFDVVLALPSHDAGAALLRRAAGRELRIKAFDPHRLDLFEAWLKAINTRLLHIHAGIGWEGHGLARRGKATGLPVVRTEHLPYLVTSPVQQAEYRAMLLSVDRRIAVSQAVFDSHLGAGSGPLHVVHNGLALHPSRQPAAETRQALGLAPTDKVLLTVARFTPQKGHDCLVAAAPAVLQQHPNAKFVLVGSGPETENIEAAIRAGGLESNVLLLGQRDDVPDLLAASDLFVLPSQFEGLPLALLEAVAADLPVVATKIGGTVEALGKAHPFLVPAGDAQALAAAINTALADPAQAQAAAVAAKERFTGHFTAQRMADQTAAIYDILLSPRGASL